MDWRIPYCAGLLDGEGHVVVKRYQTRKGSICFQPWISVSMTDCDAIVFLSNVFGVGSICEPRWERTTLGHKKQWRWTTVSHGAFQVARLIRPYVITKQAGVEAILAFYGVKEGAQA